VFFKVGDLFETNLTGFLDALMYSPNVSDHVRIFAELFAAVVARGVLLLFYYLMSPPKVLFNIVVLLTAQATALLSFQTRLGHFVDDPDVLVDVGVLLSTQMADGSVLEVDGFHVYRVVGDSVGFVAAELTLVPRHLLLFLWL